VFLALHHPIYSADEFHSGSTRMKELIETAIEQSGRHPEMILSGHVHDYQRLTKQQTDGTQVPYLIAGNGGYHNLHSIMKVDGEKMIAPVVFDDKDNDPVTLERYCDDHWGFVRLEVTDQLVTGLPGAAAAGAVQQGQPAARLFRVRLEGAKIRAEHVEPLRANVLRSSVLLPLWRRWRAQSACWRRGPYPRTRNGVCGAKPLTRIASQSDLSHNKAQQGER
jgi:hypothetical protein